MKKMMLKITGIMLLVMTAGISLKAQTTSADAITRYRITAYKNGDSHVQSVSNTVELIPPIAIYIPNAFTPNGDGLNDTFGAVGQGISEFSMQVFNRWGNLIFESNDISKQWDGTYKGEKAELGVYVYQVTAKGPKSYQLKKNGSVTLVQ